VISLWQFAFFRYAIGISFILSLLFALISLIILIRRLTFLAIGTEHAAFGGAGLADIMGLPSFPITLIFCTVITNIAGQTHKKQAEAGTSLFFSGAMALGMILLAFNKNNSFNLINFLFGDLIGVTKFDLIISCSITFIILLLLLPAMGKILYISFDRDSAIISGLNVKLWDTLIYSALSISVILGIRLVGVLLVAAMTVLPATFALLWKRKVFYTILIAFFFSIFSMISGILLSVQFDIAPGPLIVTVAVLVYFMGKLISKS